MGSSSDEEEAFLIFLILERKLKKNKRRQYARSIFQNKETTGHYHALIQEMHIFSQVCNFTELQKTLLEGQYFFCYPLKASKNIVS